MSVINFEILVRLRVLKNRNLDLWYQLRPEFFVEYRNLYNYIYDYKKNYDVLPSADFLISLTGLEVKDDESISDSFILNFLEERFIYNVLRDKIDVTLDLLGKGRVREALKVIQDAFLRINFQDGVRTVTLSTMLEEFRKDYELGMQGKIRRFRLFWEEFNNLNAGGILPGEFFVLVARPGLMKTWFLLLNALKLRLDGANVLFVSPEMGTLSITRRFVSLLLGLSISTLKMYGLERSEYEAMINLVSKIVQNESISSRFRLMSDGFDFKTRSIEAVIDKFSPDVVLIDALYLLSASYYRLNFWEQIKMVADDIKRISVQYNIPIIATTQFNRSATMLETPDLSQLAYGDAIGQNADYVFALDPIEYFPVPGDPWGGSEDEYVKGHFKSYRFRPLKVRDGVTNYYINLHVSFTKEGLYIIENLVESVSGGAIQSSKYYVHGYDSSPVVSKLTGTPRSSVN